MYTSVKSIQWGCRDGMHYAKNRGNKEIPLALLLDLPTSPFTLVHSGLIDIAK